MSEHKNDQDDPNGETPTERHETVQSDRHAFDGDMNAVQRRVCCALSRWAEQIEELRDALAPTDMASEAAGSFGSALDLVEEMASMCIRGLARGQILTMCGRAKDAVGAALARVRPAIASLGSRGPVIARRVVQLTLWAATAIWYLPAVADGENESEEENFARAIGTGDLAMLDRAAARGASLDAQGRWGQPALHLVIMAADFMEREPFLTFVSHVAARADTSARNGLGLTAVDVMPLHLRLSPELRAKLCAARAILRGM